MRQFLLSLLLLASSHAARAAAAFIVESGQPRAEIVLAENSARMAKLAARELQTYVEKISGAKLPIVATPSSSGAHIFVGKSGFTDAKQLSTDGLQNGAYRMASGPDWLALLGPDEDFVPIEPWGRMRSTQETQRVNAAWDQITGDTFWNNCRELYAHYHADLGVWDYDDAGTLNAVYAFLRGLGVRWFAPGELGEVVPKLRSIALPALNQTVTPDFALRKFMFYTEHTGIGEKALWCLRLGLNPGHKIIGVTQPCHGIKFVLMRDEMKQAHPEMYLTMGGKPNFTHSQGVGVPNVLSPLLFEKHVKYARAMFDHFQQPALNIDMVDGYSGLSGDDPQWTAQLTPDRGWMGSMSDQVWGYLNRIALAIHESHPDRTVFGLAYGSYRLPSEKIETMSPNLAIIQTRLRGSFWDDQERATSRQVREAWLKKLPSGKFVTWDTCANARPDAAGRPVVFTRQIANDLRELKGVTLGEMIEIYDHPAGQESSFGYDPLALEHLNLYLTSRYWWDANQDLDTLLADYYRGYYGPAAEAMKALLEHCEATWMRMAQDGAAASRALELLDAALAISDPKSVYGQRIQKIADLMKPMRALAQQLSRKRDTDLSYRVLLTSNTGGKPMREKKLDGTLPKDFWPDVRVAPLLPLKPGTRAKANSNFRIVREGDVLFIGIHCDEPDMAGLATPTQANDDPKLLDGDFVSLLIETPSRSYYEIAVNPAGAVLEADHGPKGAELKWSSGAQVAVHRGQADWSVEIRLPIVGEGQRVLDPLKGIDGAQPKELFPWYFNLCRQRVRSADIERTAYSPTGDGDVRATEKFAKLWGK